MLSVAMTLSLPRKENKEKLILTYNYFGENYNFDAFRDESFF